MILLIGTGASLNASYNDDLKKGCNEGISENCYMFGTLYKDGVGGIEQDILKAIDFYNKACNDGYHKGYSTLGVCRKTTSPHHIFRHAQK